MWHGPEVPASYTLSSGSYGYCYKALSLLSSGWSWIHFFLSSQCCSQHGLYCCQTHWNCIVWFKADSGRNFSPHRKSSDCFALFQSKPTPVFKKKKSQCAAACLQTEHNVHVFTECKKYPIYFTRLYLQATRHFPLSWEFGDSLQMILSFTRHENKFGAKTGRFLAGFFFHSALCNYQCNPGPMSLAVKKKELIKIVPQSFVQGVWP